MKKMKNDKSFYDYLKSIKPLSDENPAFKERLRGRLMTLVQESGPEVLPKKNPFPQFTLRIALAACAAILIIIGGVFFTFQLRTVENYGVLSFISGNVQIENNSQSQEPALLAHVGPQTVVRVGHDAAAEFQVQNLLLTRIGEDSVAFIDKINFSDGNFDFGMTIERGLALCTLGESWITKKIIISTPQAILQARGTTFLVKTDDTGTIVLVSKGVVEVISSKDPDARVITAIPEGQELFIRASNLAQETRSGPGSPFWEMVSSFQKRIMIADMEKSRDFFRITVTCTPSSALLSVNGGTAGRGEIAFIAESNQTCRVTATAPGYRDNTLEIVPQKDADYSLTLILKKEGEDDQLLNQGENHGGTTESAADSDKANKRSRTVARATIKIDGKSNDWARISPLITDPAEGAEGNVSGSDLTGLSLARDTDYLYMLIRTANGNSDLSNPLEYRLTIFPDTLSKFQLTISYSNNAWTARREETGGGKTTISFDGKAQWGDGFLEASFPLSQLKTMLIIDTAYPTQLAVFAESPGGLKVAADSTGRVDIYYYSDEE
jgi:hypothetical protein